MPEHMKVRLVGTPDGVRAELFRAAPTTPPPPPQRGHLALPAADANGPAEFFTPAGRDPRVPNPGTVTTPSRQVLRAVARGKGPRCHRCPAKVTVAAEAVLDDGHIAHRACSESRNLLIREAVAELAREDSVQRARSLGLTPDVPKLWAPPGASHDPPLDLSKGVLLGESIAS